MNDAINALTALTAAALQAAQAADRVSQMIAQANAEGRDLTTAERETIQNERHAAVDEWNQANQR